MNAKKLVIGGIVGAIIYFLLGWMTYGNLLVSYFNDHPGLTVGFHRTEPIFTYLIIGNLLQGFLLSYVFVKGRISTFGSGLRNGGMIGFFTGAARGSIMFAVTTLTSRASVAVDVITIT